MNRAQEIMEWYVAAGVDTLLEDKPINRFTEQSPQPRKSISSASGASDKSNSSAVNERLARTGTASPQQPTYKKESTGIAMPDGSAIESAKALAAEARTLEELKEAIAGFDGCNLKRTAKNMVFADGNPNAKIMFIGEPPDRNEDTQGIPFVGRAGSLFDRMLAAIELNRTSTYMTTVMPWRPPGNRTPTPQETEICRPFIERHIELANPDLVVMMGGHCAKTLLRAETTIMRLRGKWSELLINDKTFTAMPTLHPAYLLQQPAQKKLAWQDLLIIMQQMDATT